MTDTAQIEALVARIEAASGPDRELDAAIKMLVGHAWDYAADWGPRGHDRPVASAYTASLDAAMSLVPEGCTWSAGDWSAIGKGADATCWPPEDRRPVDFNGISYAATPALALVAAALKAHARQERSS